MIPLTLGIKAFGLFREKIGTIQGRETREFGMTELYCDARYEVQI